MLLTWKQPRMVAALFHQELLWVQVMQSNDEDALDSTVNITGEGEMEVLVEKEGRLEPVHAVSIKIPRPRKVVCFRRDFPPLSVIKVIDATGGIVLRIATAEPLVVES